jgi:hypothetical protein
MHLREYRPETDRAAVHRIWHEIGWLEKGKEEILDLFLTDRRTWVAELEGQPECVVQTAPATIQYLEEELPASIVTSVGTSHVSRKRGAPKRLLARMLALDASDGALLSGLGIFDQGFYDRLGFGTGSYENVFDFDPATLTVPARFRAPRRLTPEDWPALHAARVARRPGHGKCNMLSPVQTRTDLSFGKNGFGLGYCDGPNGELSHYLWLEADDMEVGPYRVKWSVFRTVAQFRELMALLRGFEDQVRLIHMRELPGVPLQDLLSRPFRHHSITRRGSFENRADTVGYWQTRILSLAGCVARTHLVGPPARFNLVLRDPITELLDDDAPWRGIGGGYVLEVGAASRATPGHDPSLPTLTASVNAFSRLWFGVRPATGLAYTDELSGPEELLHQLDLTFRLPEPKPDWDF